MTKPVQITAGDVIEVQLTSETVVFDRGDGSVTAEPGHITNRMRLFVRELDGAERKYDFEDTELGVRETQRVAIVQGVPKRGKAPVHLILFNLSSGESDIFERGLRAFLDDGPKVASPLKALIAGLAWALLFWLVARYGFAKSEGFANVYSVMSALLLLPFFWWGARAWDNFTQEWRYQAACKKLIADADGRVRAYEPKATTAAA